MTQRNILDFDQKLNELKEAGCEGVAMFTTDSKDVSVDELAAQACDHAVAILEVIEGASYQDAKDLGF